MNDKGLAELCKYAYENEDFAIENRETDTQVFLFSDSGRNLGLCSGEQNLSGGIGSQI